MMLATLLLALQPGAPAPDPRLACAPRRNLTAAGPRPPVLYAQRLEQASQARTDLSVHLCPDGSFRVQRLVSARDTQAPRSMDWVPVSQCAAIGRWIQAATRLRLPAPLLRPHRARGGGTWFTFHARTISGPSQTGNIELEILDPPGAAPSALSGWFVEGERVFQACRDRGHGGAGYLPFRPGARL